MTVGLNSWGLKGQLVTWVTMILFSLFSSTDRYLPFPVEVMDSFLFGISFAFSCSLK